MSQTAIRWNKLWATGLSACLVLAALPIVAAEPAKSGSTDWTKLSAEELVTRAREARASWAGLPGFSADFTVATGGNKGTGRLEVDADGTVTVTLSDPKAHPWVEGSLRSLVGHRLASSSRDEKVRFAEDQLDHPLGRLIAIEDVSNSTCRIRDDVIYAIERTHGNNRFAISVIEVARNPEGKVLSAHYTVSYWDVPTGNLRRATTTRDTWVRVGKFDLPKSVLVIETRDDGHHEAREIVFSNHKLGS
jgi:hypothetical protein